MREALKMAHILKKEYDKLCLPIMKEYSISRAELDIILFLHNNPEFDNAKDIVKMRGLSKSHTSMGIEHLVNKGYLIQQQDSDDKRYYHLILQKSAMPIINSGVTLMQQFTQLIYSGLSQKEINQYQQIQQKIYQNITEKENH